MKRILFLLPTILLLAACSRKDDHSGYYRSYSAVYRGVVIIQGCGYTTIETLPPHYLGEENWAERMDDTLVVHHHVFRVQNACQFRGREVGDTIAFRIVPKQLQTCGSCTMIVPAPATMYAIEVVDLPH